MKKFTSFLIIIVLTSFEIIAQDKGIADTVHTLNSVEVTASKRKKIETFNFNVPIKDIPMTVTQLSSKTLERKNITSLDEAIKFMPGVTVTDQFGAFQRFSIRGTSDAVVAVNGVRDERSLLTSTPFGDLSAAETIEVIKGPASVLSGHSVMGGMINIIYKKPTNIFSADAKITYGSWNTKQATIGFGGKLYKTLNYRANIHYSNGDGYRNVGAERFSGMFALSSKITKNGVFEANVGFNDDKYRTEIGSAPLMPGNIYSVKDNKPFAKNGDLNPMADYLSTVYNDWANNKMRRRNIDLSLQYTHKLTNWMNIKERFTFNHSNLDYSCVEKMSYRTSTKPVYDWYYMNAKGVKTYVELDSLQSGTPLCFNPDSRGYTNSLEFTGTVNLGKVSNNYTLGWYYSFFDYTQYNGYGKDDVWGPGLNQMLPLNNPHTVRNWWDSKVSEASIRRYETNGIYLYDVLNISKHWKAMAGARIDFYNYRTATAKITDGRQHYEKENRTDWKKVKTSAVTYRAGIVYNPVNAISLYVSASSYFKPIVTTYSPSVIYLDKDGNKFNPDEHGGEVFKPEKGNQAEFGIKYITPDDKLEINASVFYIQKYNVVKRLGTVDVEENGAVINKTVQAQVGRAVSKGFDIEIIYRPVPNLQIVAGSGWSDYRLKKSKVNMEEWPDFTETTNVRATGVPRTTLFAYADYTIQRGVLQNLSFHLSTNYRDKIYRNVNDNLYFPSLWLMDAGVYYTIKRRIRLSFLMNNVLNKEYFIKTTTLGKPRNFTASISYTFG